MVKHTVYIFYSLYISRIKRETNITYYYAQRRTITLGK